jgi:hypothetical protein
LRFYQNHWSENAASYFYSNYTDQATIGTR